MKTHKLTQTQLLYKELCEEEKTIPLWQQFWWFEAICPGQWEVLLVEENGKIMAALPYHFRTKLGMKFILQPQLTQATGPWLRATEKTESNGAKTDADRLTYEKNYLGKLIVQLERLGLSYYEQGFHFNFTNWLPFYWAGYKQSIRYPYLIENIGNYEKGLSRFSSAKQRQLRKAEKAEFSFEFDLKPDEFYALHKQFLASRKEGAMIDYSYLLFLRLWKVATTRKQGQIFALRDKQGNLHCAHFIVWDSISAYDLLYFINPSYASSGASTLVIANILKWLNGKTRSFDFEGSMIESVENSYRQFGTVQKAYFQINKAFNPLAGWLINWKKH